MSNQEFSNTMTSEPALIRIEGFYWKCVDCPQMFLFEEQAAEHSKCGHTVFRRLRAELSNTSHIQPLHAETSKHI